MTAHALPLLPLLLVLFFLVAPATPYLLSFSPAFPSVEPGSMGQTSFRLRLALNAPGNVTCALFHHRPPPSIPPPPTDALLLGPVVDPDSPTRLAGDNPEDTDPVAAFFLDGSRTQPVVVAGPSTSTTTVLMVASPQASNLQRRLDVYCVAVPNPDWCAAQPEPADVRCLPVQLPAPLTVTLLSLHGSAFVDVPASSLLAYSTGVFDYQLQDGGSTVAFDATVGGNEKVFDIPLKEREYATSTTTLSFVVKPREAFVSSYVLGVTDGLVSWLVYLTRTNVRLLQLPYSRYFETSVGSSTHVSPFWFVDDSKESFTLTFTFDRHPRLGAVTVSRTNSHTFVIPQERVLFPGGPLRMVAYKVNPSILSFVSVNATLDTAPDLIRHNTVLDLAPADLYDRNVLNTWVVTPAGPGDSTVQYLLFERFREVVRLPLPYESVPGAAARISALVEDSTSSLGINDVALAVGNGTVMWVVSRRLDFLNPGVGFVDADGNYSVALLPDTDVVTREDDETQVGMDVEYDGGGSTTATIRTTEKGVEFSFDGVEGAGPLTGDLFFSVLHNTDDPAVHTLSRIRIEITEPDTIPPTVILTTDTIRAPAWTNAVARFTMTFSEVPNAGVDASGVSLVNANATSYEPLNVLEAVFTVEPLEQGYVSVQVPVGSVSDTLHNVNTVPSNSIEFLYDTIRPNQTMATDVPPFANVSTLADGTVRVSFSEDPIALSASDFAIHNGNVTALFQTPGAVGVREWTVTVAPQEDGPMNVSLPDGVYQDRATNVNRPVWTAWIYDSTPPTAHLYTPRPPISSAPIAEFELTLSEDVVDVSEASIHAVNGVVQNLRRVNLTTTTVAAAGNDSLSGDGSTAPPWPGQTLTVVRFEVVPIVDGNVTVELLPHVVVDYALNGNVASGFGRVAVETTVYPDGYLEWLANATAANANSNSTANVTDLLLDFPGGVPMLNATECLDELGNVTVVMVNLLEDVADGGSGGNATSFRSRADVLADDGLFNCTAIVLPAPFPIVTTYPLAPFNVTSTSPNATDFVGPVQFLHDTLEPVVTVASPTLKSHHADFVPEFEVIVSETAYRLTVDSINVTGGVPTNLRLVPHRYPDMFIDNPDVSNPPQTYTFNVEPTRQGTIFVSVVADSVFDRADNPNAESNVVSFVHDTVDPAVVVTSDTEAYTIPTTLQPFRLILSEPVWPRDVVPVQIRTFNAKVDSVDVVPGTGYTEFEFSLEIELPEETPNGPSPVRVSVVRCALRDQAGNCNQDSTTTNFTASPSVFEFTYEILVPPPPPLWPLILAGVGMFIGCVCLSTCVGYAIVRFRRWLNRPKEIPPPPPLGPPPPPPPKPPPEPVWKRGGGPGIDYSLEGKGDPGLDYKNPFDSLTGKNDPRRNVLLLPSISIRNKLRRDPHSVRSTLTPEQQREKRDQDKRIAEQKARRKADRKAKRKAEKEREKEKAKAARGRAGGKSRPKPKATAPSPAGGSGGVDVEMGLMEPAKRKPSSPMKRVGSKTRVAPSPL